MAKESPKVAKASAKITTSSTAEYFSKNLQQVGFSSQVKAVLTTLKEAVDNALDACEEYGILPEIEIWVEKLGSGTLKGSDKVRVIMGPVSRPTTSRKFSANTWRLRNSAAADVRAVSKGSESPPRRRGLS